MYKVLVICSLAVLYSVETVAVKERPHPHAQTSIDEDRYLQILSRVENLERRDKEQQAEIDGLRSDNNGLRSDNNGLRSDNNELRSELQTEKHRTSTLEEIISRLRLYGSNHGDDGVKVTPGEAEPQDRETTRSDAGEQIQGHNTPSGAKIPRIRRQAEVPVIAFHATLTHNQEHSGQHQGIAFDNVVTNIGSAYNKLHGNFNAPVPGVYVFSTTILGYGNNAMTCSVVKNGKVVANLWMKDSATNYDSDSATVVLHLNKGDEVAVENESTDKLIHGYHYSMFSGFLLHEDESSSAIIGK